MSRFAQYKVGSPIPSLTKPPITHTDLVKYSGASGDYNPIHTVEHFAQSVGLGGVIAHGMLTMAYVGQMLTDFIGLDADLLSFGVRFRAMVRPGDIVTCKGTVTGVEELPDKTVMHLDVWAENQRGETVVKGSAKIAY